MAWKIKFKDLDFNIGKQVRSFLVSKHLVQIYMYVLKKEIPMTNQSWFTYKYHLLTEYAKKFLKSRIFVFCLKFIRECAAGIK